MFIGKEEGILEYVEFFSTDRFFTKYSGGLIGSFIVSNISVLKEERVRIEIDVAMLEANTGEEVEIIYYDENEELVHSVRDEENLKKYNFQRNLTLQNEEIQQFLFLFEDAINSEEVITLSELLGWKGFCILIDECNTSQWNIKGDTERLRESMKEEEIAQLSFKACLLFPLMEK